MTNYEEELIQVAAVAVAMVQVHRRATTERESDSAHQTEREIFREICDERARQEEKFGTRSNTFSSPRYVTREFWYTILGEEFGEVGRAILERQF